MCILQIKKIQKNQINRTWNSPEKKKQKKKGKEEENYVHRHKLKPPEHL